MKITNGTGYGSITCGLSISKDLTVYSQVPIDHLETVSVGYAVCHFLKETLINSPSALAGLFTPALRCKSLQSTKDCKLLRLDLAQKSSAIALGSFNQRFLKNSPKAAARYIRASYHMRLAKGKQRKVKTCWLYGPSSPLELPGEWACIRLSVGPEGITVERVELYANWHRVQPPPKVPK